MQRRAPFQTTVLILAAVLALAAGLAIVFVTSPESVKRSLPILLTQFAPPSSPQPANAQSAETPTEHSSTPVGANAAVTSTDASTATAVASATATIEGSLTEVTQSPTVLLTQTEDSAPSTTHTLSPNPTLSVTPTSNPTLPTTPTPTLSPASLPTFIPGASAIAIVALEAGVSAWLRDAPAGNGIGGVLGGTYVQVLQGRQVAEERVWVEVIAETGQNGWIAEDVLQILATPEPG